MELSITEQFVILAINPAKGRLAIDNTHFRYTLSGALLMDYLDKGEIALEDKRLVPLFRKNGVTLHDMFAEIITKASKHRRVSFWVRRLTQKSRYIFRETINSLEKNHFIRKERKKFLNIIPYNRFWITDISIRTNLVEELRGILLYGKQAGRKQSLLLGLIATSRAHSQLAKEKGETRLLRKKNSEFLKGDIMSAEINQAIREVQAAIMASVTAATVASTASHH